MGFTIRRTQPFEADLARLADGSLPAGTGPELRASVGPKPDLARALAQQEQVVSLLRSVDEPAPAALRARIEAMAAPSSPPARRPRRMMLAAVTAVAVTAAVLISATSGGRTLPSVVRTAQLALAPARSDAPVEDAAHRGLLAASVDRVSFPYWRPSFGWRAVGTRTDVLNARRIVTVYYTDPAGARVGYSIVAGAALTTPPGEVLTRHGIRFSLIHRGSLRIITWLRSGHTCVLAGSGISGQVLLRLASGNPRQSLQT